MARSTLDAERRWRPLLKDELAERATAAVVAVADALDAGRFDDASLGRGSAGIAIFYDYLGRAGLLAEAGDRATTALDSAIDAVAGGASGPSLYTGFSGVAWATALIDAGTTSPDDGNDEVDEVVASLVSRPPWTRPYDLIDGLVGLGVYALERMPRPAASVLLEHVVARLGELADHQPNGITWFTRPELLPPENRRAFPRGLYDLGLAHGVSGVVALLSGCVAAGIAVRPVSELLEGAVAWISSHRLAADEPARFPAVVSAGVQPSAARSAWCYGDPGVASALLLAAQALDHEEWEREAIEVALGAARRPPSTTGVRDACLCHGAAGLAHLFNRLHQATGVDDLARAATYWYGETYAMRKPGHGVGGFTTSSDRSGTGGATAADPGFLQGAAGIGLSFAAGITAVEPEWDRALLLSARTLP
jgi:lantibiotic modifying enzyme